MRVETQTLRIHLFLAAMLMSGCSGSFDFSEKLQVKNFLKASNLFLEAGRYRKEIFEENQPERIRMGTITDGQLKTFIRKLEAARTEALKVSDSVLSKIHPGLPIAFKNLMIRSVDRQIASMNLTSMNLTSMNPASVNQGDIYQAIEDQMIGMTLHNEWIRWWNANHREFVTK